MPHAFVSFLPFSQSRCSTFTGTRCVAPQTVNRVPKRRAVHLPVAVADPFTPGTLLIAKDITFRIFMGGLGIVFSGIVGVAVTAYLVSKNFDTVS